MDETKALRHAFLLARVADQPIQLTIAPTLDCNFGCAYCFESHGRGLMPAEVRDGIIRLLEAITEFTPHALGVTWFGGEPLLALPVIVRLSEKIRALVQSGRIASWSSRIITSGYLATPAVLQRIVRQCGLESMQVTLDGPRAIHDTRRVPRFGRKASFDRICDNLVACRAAFPDLRFDIRVNLDRSNSHAIEDLMAELEAKELFAEPRTCRVYLAQVEGHSTPEYLVGDLLTNAEMASLQVQIDRTCRRRGWPLQSRGFEIRHQGVCQVDHRNGRCRGRSCGKEARDRRSES